ncbi:MAG TPA: SAM-dependent methyltransferase [Methylotenera sp.]|nr:SAM-dependent methyltransferase [Methylotenera sp.]HPH06589.1 SAM-dependent methyltransferase [Methylotenera sp.]HPN02030.1 SAM-dependent methyltransferase [Methylotenera sp.]
MSTLPTPSPEAQKHSNALIARIKKRIADAGDWLSFFDFMQMALYEPALGYYSGGAKKFGLGGDFVTAPEISPLFAHTLARQVAQGLAMASSQNAQADILELGAGTGKLAADLLLELQALAQLPTHYFILEVSDHLRKIQFETIKKYLPEGLVQRVQWINILPQTFTGVMLGNEVLDAVPTHIVITQTDGIYERGVAVVQEKLVWQDRHLEENSSLYARHLLETASKLNLPNDYVTEINLAARGLIASLANILQQGVILMIDYGFAAREYYHPQRNQGTLMCHYQHYAHTDSLINIGLQDITAHVNFTEIAEIGLANGLTLSGFCSQAQFLMNCGVLDLLSQVSPTDMARYAPIAAAAQKLLSPAEMGDLFKVIALTKTMDAPLIGFVNGDKSHTL